MHTDLLTIDSNEFDQLDNNDLESLCSAREVEDDDPDPGFTIQATSNCDDGRLLQQQDDDAANENRLCTCCEC